MSEVVKCLFVRKRKESFMDVGVTVYLFEWDKEVGKSKEIKREVLEAGQYVVYDLGLCAERRRESK